MVLHQRRNFSLCLRLRFKSTSSAQLLLCIIGVPVVFLCLKKTTFVQVFPNQHFNLNGWMYVFDIFTLSQNCETPHYFIWT